ncbi:MAG: F0F1 ATP synthase subunit epsilon [bacterium]|nr:F0F1 ATP synthase subunit epsilon [bacterium]
MLMNLKIITPLEIFYIKDVSKIRAEGLEGNFVILPNHADYVSSITTSIFSFETENKTEFFAVDGGILVKYGENVEFSIRHAIKGNDLKSLKQQMEISFKEMEEEDKQTRTALASLEGNIAKLIQDLGNN